MIGRRLPPERHSYTDRITGARVTRWTNAPAMHHPLYFTTCSMPVAERLFFVSYRTGHPNLFACELPSGELTQLTDRVDLNPFSASATRTGAQLYASAGEQILQIDVATGDCVAVARFPGARLGIVSLSRDDRRAAVSCRYSDHCELVLLELQSGAVRRVMAQPEIGHVQFRPSDPDSILYSGPPGARLWMVRADGSGRRSLYQQASDEWLVHESWLGDGAELIVTRWPRDLLAIAPDSGAVRVVAEFPAWHACGSPDGQRIVCDTARPARGLFLIDAAGGSIRRLCDPHATCQGSQWARTRPAAGAGIDTSILRGDDPARDPAPTPATPEGVYGPQWTHPHPSFSADGRQVVFTGDQGGGWSHVYTVEVPDA